MIVHSSHLSLRFYKRNGWTREILEPLLTKGKLIEQDSLFPDMHYFIPEAHSLLDIDKLCTIATNVVTWENKVLQQEEMKKYFKEMSW